MSDSTELEEGKILTALVFPDKYRATEAKVVLMRLADEGKIAQMPGVTAAFEEPKSPDLVLQTDQISVEESVHRVVELMRARGYLREPPLRR